MFTNRKVKNKSSLYFRKITLEAVWRLYQEAEDKQRDHLRKNSSYIKSIIEKGRSVRFISGAKLIRLVLKLDVTNREKGKSESLP